MKIIVNHKPKVEPPFALGDLVKNMSSRYERIGVVVEMQPGSFFFAIKMVVDSTPLASPLPLGTYYPVCKICDWEKFEGAIVLKNE
jgi:hypothetical protein